MKNDTIMKKITIWILGGLLAYAPLAHGQELSRDEVPSLVRNAFTQQFAEATDVEWKQRGNLYHAEFETGHIDHDVLFDGSGKLVKHRQDIRKNELPESVKTAIDRDFKGYYIEDAEKTEAKEVITYRVELKTLTNEWTILFAEDGSMLDKWQD